MPPRAASPTLLKIAIDQASEPVLIADAAGRIAYANAALGALVGVGVDRLRGRHFSTLIGNADHAASVELIADRVARGQPWTGPLLGRRPDGSRFHLDLSVAPVRAQGEAVTHSIAQMRDASGERQVADALTGALRQQAAIGAALAGLDPSSAITALADEVARDILTLEGVDLCRVMAFGTRDRAEVLAHRSSGPLVPRQLWLASARTRELRERAATEGAWVEAWAGRDHGRYGNELASAGIRAVGFAPLRHAGRAVGLLAIGTLDPQGIPVLERHLTALSHFGAIVSGLLGQGLAARQHDADLRGEIEALIAERAFTSVFQPIVRLADQGAISYEALTRFADGTPPERRFADAATIDLGIELERATLAAALEAADGLPSDAIVSLNVSPQFVLGGRGLSEILERSPRPVVLEISEREPIEDYPAFRNAIASLGVAAAWAVDDAGAGYSSLRHIIELRPEYVKLHHGLVRGVNGDAIRQALLTGMVHFATSIGVELVAEGIETDAERVTLAGLGVEFGQGFLFGRPGPAGDVQAHPRSESVVYDPVCRCGHGRSVHGVTWPARCHACAAITRIGGHAPAGEACTQFAE